MSTILNSLSDTKTITLITSGQVGVIPTDTVYGLVCSAANPQAVKRLYALKSRDKKPGTLMAASIDQLVALGLKARYLNAVGQFWPGAVSVLIPCGSELAYLHLGLRSLAVRVTADPALQDLLLQTGPLLTTSANQPGKPPANTVSEAQAYFGDSLDFYVDGGDLSGRQPSTLIRIVDDAIEVLRQGAVAIEENE